ncbi:MAG: AmmeMemoRadiSam system protein B [Chloroflexi bacterium]|nr:AmmeMemoRadiSam system protein B [Chloroflexota bacterium]
MDRPATFAGMFYPAGEAACRREIEAYLSAAEPDALGKPIIGGVVPHAGWVYSGLTAAHVFRALQGQPAPETVIVFGAVHSWGVPGPSLSATGQWQTPLGPLAIDEELAATLLAEGEGTLADRPDAHTQEHAIEVQLPFIKYLFPTVRILPIATPPLASAARAGEHVARAVQALGRRAVVLGSTDLTHYGPRYGIAPVGVGEAGLRWAHENDARLLEKAVGMDADGVMAEAQAHHNACGPGAVAATIRTAAGLGATEGHLLHYTTSHDVMPQGQPTDLVGYGAIVYV